MKKKVCLIVICCIVFVVGFVKLYQYIRVKNAKVEVTLVDDLTVEFGEQRRISDFIVKMNGDQMKDQEILFDQLGKKEISFVYTNDDHIKVQYQFFVEVVDTVKPLIWLGSQYRVKKDNDIDFTKVILCGDNSDRSPKCFVEGSYDIHTPGEYPLTFKAIDSSGNESEQKFILTVYEPVIEDKEEEVEDTRVDFLEYVKNYKNENTQIGIDLSSHQGDVDFEKLKNAGVEFVILRVGSKSGKGKFFLDQKFKHNMELAKKYDIPVGVYFYSYAENVFDAKKEALWVLKQIKGYNIELHIVFDWEEWHYFNYYHLSFYELNRMASSFIKTVEDSSYQGMLYSSKAYLESIWEPFDHVWLAHYTSQTSYEGTYDFWQLTSNGKVDGVEGPVDINIYYPKRK